jgi:hypothetical protein
LILILQSCCHSVFCVCEELAKKAKETTTNPKNKNKNKQTNKEKKCAKGKQFKQSYLHLS